MMQRPTCTRLRVRSPLDAQIIFHAVSLGILPMVARRLDTEERRAIHSGCVFVWEERGANAEATGVRKFGLGGSD
jgi:Gti1/Pac2 family transcription factor